MDPERIVTDPLHATLRLHPKLFWFAFMDPLSNKVPNADKLVERAANMLRAVTGFKKFCTIQFVDKSEIVEWSLKEHHSTSRATARATSRTTARSTARATRILICLPEIFRRR